MEGSVVDILGSRDARPLEAGDFIRFHDDDDNNNWVNVEIHDGAIHVRGVRGLLIEPITGNCIRVALRP